MMFLVYCLQQNTRDGTFEEDNMILVRNVFQLALLPMHSIVQKPLQSVGHIKSTYTIGRQQSSNG